ncbi:hypothetical protein FA15DRAFT_693982 [Coprinopsis marcescibilis]|uniref:TPR-like protein n=1 Tax=Coprinopsis marcescibilis TaxID=230819 RepID=A0A5C3KXG9_COPMA|nr:hypothetical protein FA15DRAFT_693982 [Coprinopsis marcescibilis]
MHDLKCPDTLEASSPNGLHSNSPKQQAQAPTLRDVAETAHESDDVERLENAYLNILSNQLGKDLKLLQLYHALFGALATLKSPLSLDGIASLYGPDGLATDEVDRICVQLRPLLLGYGTETHQPIQLVHPSLRQYLTQRAPQPYRINLNDQHLKLSRLLLLTIQRELSLENVACLGFTSGTWTLSDVPEIPTLTRADLSETLWYAGRFMAEHTFETPPERLDEAHKTLLYDTIFKSPRHILELTMSIGNIIDMRTLRRWISGASLVDKTEMRAFAQALYGSALCLKESQRFKAATRTVREAVAIYYRLLAITDDQDIKQDFALCLSLFSGSMDGRHSISKSRMIKDAVDIIRPLAKANPSGFEATFGILLTNRSIDLFKVEKQPALALEAGEEAAEILRRQASADHDKYGASLGASLYVLSIMYLSSDRHREACERTQENIDLFRRLAEAKPSSARRRDLARALDTHGAVLALHMKRPQDAVKCLKEAIQILHELAPGSPRCRQDLALSLGHLADVYKEWPNYVAESITLIKRAIDHARKLRDMGAFENPLRLKTDLAMYLHTLAECLRKKADYAKAIASSKEAADIRRQIAAESAETLSKTLHQHRADVASALQHLADDHAKVKNHHAAEEIGKEVVGIRRELAHLEFSGDAESQNALAISLERHSHYLQSIEQVKEAIDTWRESLEIRKWLAEDDPVTYEPPYARSLQDLSSFLSDRKQHDEAASLLPEAVSAFRRVMIRSPRPDCKHRLALALREMGLCYALLKSYEKALEAAEEALGIFGQLASVYPSLSKYWCETRGFLFFETVLRRKCEKGKPKNGISNPRKRKL